MCMRHPQSGISTVEQPREAAGLKANRKRGMTPFSPFRASLSSRPDPWSYQTLKASQATRVERGKGEESDWQTASWGYPKRKEPEGQTLAVYLCGSNATRGYPGPPRSVLQHGLHRRACSENTSSAGRALQTAVAACHPSRKRAKPMADSSQTMLPFSSSHAHVPQGREETS
jgi:hypothetical protein